MPITKNARWYARTLSRLQRQLRDAIRRPSRSPAVRLERIKRIEERIVMLKLRW